MRVLCRRTNKEYTKYCLAYSLFQSTSSVWRTTPHCGYCGPLLRYFNPRPPCGGRPVKAGRIIDNGQFQSTSSVWRTTLITSTRGKRAHISIHVLRVEDDDFVEIVKEILPYFNPRPPCGGRRKPYAGYSAAPDFNPRPPCGGRQALQCNTDVTPVFQSTSSVWRTTHTR